MRKSSLAVAASLLIVVSSANAAPPTNLVGMTVTSYTMSGSSTNRSLSFQSASNGSFNSSFVNGVNTGDQVAQTGSDSWTLGAFAYDISPVVGYPFPTNIVGIEANTTSGAFSGSSVISCTYTLVFSGNQQFLGLSNTGSFAGGIADITATLTSGGTTTNLATAATDGSVVFPAGTYTLALQGNDYSTTTATLVAIFAGQASAVPGTGIAALLGASIVPRRRRR
ncbi:MAG: hypothetical protein ACO3P9_09150 [Phycisphaerales bacterium]